MEKKKNGFLYWTPRILGICMILFLALFSLDVIGMSDDPLQVALGMLVHNIPSILLIVLLLVSWKWELVGGIIYPLLGLSYSLFNPSEHWTAHLLIAGPLILIGLFFLLNWKSNRRMTHPAAQA